MSLVEICSSKYKHSPLEVFGKKYYKQKNGDKRLCEECINAYVEEVSSNITDIISRYFNSLDMKNSSIVNNVYRENEFNITTNISVSEDIFEYQLPVKYSIKTSLFYKEYFEEVTIEGYTDSEKHYKIGNVQISSINCPDMFPTFIMTLDIRDVDSSEYIKSVISEYINAYIMMTYEELPDEIVKVIMNNLATTVYHSACGCATHASSATGCKMCNGSIMGEHYIYHNKQYCLDCMYGIVVDSARANNITDDIGLSSDALSMSSTMYVIVNTPEYKRTVISRYINVMSELGANPNICHVQITMS